MMGWDANAVKESEDVRGYRRKINRGIILSIAETDFFVSRVALLDEVEVQSGDVES